MTSRFIGPLRRSIDDHPEWCARQHALAIGCTQSLLYLLRKRHGGLTFGTPPSKPGGVALRQSIAEHPDWTTADHSRALGISWPRVHYLVVKYRLVVPLYKRRAPDSP